MTSSMSRPSLTIEERILLILLDNIQFRDEFEVPPAMTQEGLAQISTAARPNVARSLKNLAKKGKTDERMAHVKGQRRRKKVYFLLPEAVTEAQELKRHLGELKVKTPDGEVALEKAASEADLTLVAAYTQVDKQLNFGAVEEDLEPLPKPEKPAPKIKARPFFGRKKELKAINDWTANDGSRVLLVHGMPGIGKTTLVERFSKGYEGAVWYRFPPLNSLGGVLHGIELALGGKTGIGEYSSAASLHAPADIATALVEDIDGKLLVLDDLHFACVGFIDVLSALVAVDSNCKIIITSRNKGGFYNRRDVKVHGTVKEVTLTGLGENDALDMLKKRGIEGEKAQLILRRSGGHPIALELVEFISESEDDAVFTDVQEFVREEVLGKLSDKELDALRFLSVFRGPIPRDSSVLRRVGLEPEAIDSLVERALVENTTHGLKVHGLIRTVVVDRVSPEDWTRFNSMAADHYSKDKQDLESVMEAMYHCSISGRGEDLVELLRARGMLALREGFVELIMLMVEVDPSELSKEDAAWFHYMLGYGTLMVGDEKGAAKSLGKAEELCAKLKDQSLDLGVNEALGRMLKDDSKVALGHFRKAISSYEGMEEQDGENVIRAVSAYNGAGLALKGQGETGGAEKAYRSAIKLAQDFDLQDQQAAAMFNLGQLHEARGEIVEAKDILNKGLDLAKDVGDEHLIMGYLATLGGIAAGEDDFDTALKYYEDALEHAVSSADLWETANNSLEIGERYRRSKMERSLATRLVSFIQGKKWEELWGICQLYEHICMVQRQRGLGGSAPFHRKAVTLFDELGQEREAAKARNNLAVVLKSEGDHDGALHHYEEALQINTNIGDLGGQAITHFNMGMLLRLMERDEDARQHFEEAGRLFEKLGRKKEAARAKELQVEAL